jgi:hypothetical protein
MEEHTHCIVHSPDAGSVVVRSPEHEILPLSMFDLNSRFKLSNSWVCSPRSEKLFWVPPQCHAGLYQPSNHVIIGPLLKTRLDFNKFQHGTVNRPVLYCL